MTERPTSPDDTEAGLLAALSGRDRLIAAAAARLEADLPRYPSDTHAFLCGVHAWLLSWTGLGPAGDPEGFYAEVVAIARAYPEQIAPPDDTGHATAIATRIATALGLDHDDAATITGILRAELTPATPPGDTEGLRDHANKHASSHVSEHVDLRGRIIHAIGSWQHESLEASADAVLAVLSEDPGDLRERIGVTLRDVFDHRIIAEWICCDPINPEHDLCARGQAAREMVASLLEDDQTRGGSPSPILDAVLPVFAGFSAHLAAENDRLRRELAQALEGNNRT